MQNFYQAPSFGAMQQFQGMGSVFNPMSQFMGGIPDFQGLTGGIKPYYKKDKKRRSGKRRHHDSDSSIAKSDSKRQKGDS